MPSFWRAVFGLPQAAVARMNDRPHSQDPFDPLDRISGLDTGAHDALPKRSNARKHIDTPPLPPPTTIAGGRKLTRAERRELKERYEGRHTAPLPAGPASEPDEAPLTWWRKSVVLALLGVLVISVGAGRFLTGNDPTPTPAPSPAPIQIAAASPTDTATPSATATITATASPAATATIPPTPSMTPTPNAAYNDFVVCLDPGHGGWDSGFTRTGNEVAPAMREADVNLGLALALRDRLEALGFRVVMTRETDDAVDPNEADWNGDGEAYHALIDTEPARAIRARQVDELQARISKCNDAGADLLVSMHINGIEDPAIHGIETWYSGVRPFSDQSKRFASYVEAEMRRKIEEAGYDANSRGVKDDTQSNAPEAGEVFSHYIMIGPRQPGAILPSDMPGSIVESLFISNDQDAAFLNSDKGKTAIVNAYERAIQRYVDKTTAAGS